MACGRGWGGKKITQQLMNNRTRIKLLRAAPYKWDPWGGVQVERGGVGLGRWQLIQPAKQAEPAEEMEGPRAEWPEGNNIHFL